MVIIKFYSPIVQRFIGLIYYCCIPYTPKHGSWLNMAEIELNVLIGQCLNRRIDSIEDAKTETAAWEKVRNNRNAKVNWQFTTEDARIKLSRLYPTLES